MTMKILAVVTEDFAFYHDLVGKLKRRGISFISLGLGEPVPSMVGAVVTTANEAPRVEFDHVFPADEGQENAENRDEIEKEGGKQNEMEMEMALDRALAHLQGKESIELLVIGIDPGKRPGLAILGDAQQLKTEQVATPEDVGPMTRRLVRTFRPRDVLVRLGDGAPTQRDRILNGISAAMEGSGEAVKVELVDERNSSDVPHHSDTGAALKIALTPGKAVFGWRTISPSEGELRELQRRSRILSGGRLTISKELALKVALGELTMAEAIDDQTRGEPTGGGGGDAP
jgi:hypothetical protein